MGASMLDKARRLFEKSQEIIDNEQYSLLAELGREVLDLLDQVGDEGMELVPDAHMIIGVGHLHMGNFEQAREEFEKMLSLYEAQDAIDELKEAAMNLGQGFIDAGRGEMILPWCDRIIDAYRKTEGASRAFAADGYAWKFEILVETDPEAALAALDDAYEAVFEDPYGYVMTDRAQMMNAEYRALGASERALSFVDRGIQLLEDRYASADVPKETDERFVGDYMRFKTFRSELERHGTTPRPVVTLQAERAMLLLDLDNREDEVIQACEIVAAARDADIARMEESPSEMEEAIADLSDLGELSDGQVSFKPMTAAATEDVYEAEFLYVYGEALRRKGKTEEAKQRLEAARSVVDEEDEEELAEEIDEALSKL